MELGLAFDDEDLECNEKNTVGDRHLPYNVKICTTQWFLESLQDQPPKDEEQLLLTLKFCGDYHYQQKDFIAAAKNYEGIIDIISDKGYSALWHDVKESLSRCYVYTDQLEKGLEIAKEMVSVAENEDDPKQRQALSLLMLVYERSGKWTECIDCLERLCGMQSQFQQPWQNLGDMYSVMKSHEGTSIAEDDVCLAKQLTCYIRAKILVESVMGNVTDFLRERNTEMIKQLNDKIDDVPAPDRMKECATEFISREIENQAPSSKDSSDGESKDSQSRGTFYERFCSWDYMFKR